MSQHEPSFDKREEVKPTYPVVSNRLPTVAYMGEGWTVDIRFRVFGRGNQDRRVDFA